MKNKAILFSIFLIISSLLIGCSSKVGDTYQKTEYLKEENAIIDYYEMIYKGYSSKNKKLYVNFVVTNNSSETKEINLREDFRLYTDTSEKIINLSDEEIIKIQNNETKEIRVTFESDSLFENETLIDLDSYKIIFYSGVVSNNIAFILE